MKKRDQDKVVVMKSAGEALGAILIELLDMAAVGVSLLDIEKEAMAKIKKAGGTASFTTVADYKWATCLCVNDVIVHGIPTEYVLKDGDLLTIDVGMFRDGFHTDTAWSKMIGEPKKDVQKFLDVGQRALWEAIAMARAGNRVGHITKAIQDIVLPQGYGIVKSLVGHGVGKTLHEAPQIPGILKGTIENTPKLVEGMTIAIEVIYTMGSPQVVYVNDDGWSIGTNDGSLTAVFEHTVAITAGDPLVLTQSVL
ncbi:MAG: type I methionyl aminopeptidase [Patescibacteria group bacterium]